MRLLPNALRKSGWRLGTPPYAGIDRQVGDMAMYAGMGVGHVRAEQPAVEVVADLSRLL